MAANSREGVYTTFSCLGALGFGEYLPDSWNLSPDGSRWATRGSWFWDPRLRDAYKAWLRTFFTEVNLHTGIPLGEDPSIAYVQLMAEDGMLFYTSTNVEGTQRRMLEGIFGKWLERKYGSLDQAIVAWGGCRHADDAPEAGRMGLYDMWEFGVEMSGREATFARMADQLEFFSLSQRSFYDEMRRFCREELGMKHLFMSDVWRTADDERMLDMERWTYAGVDIGGKSHFFNSPHQVPPGKPNTAGYQINSGDFVQPRSALRSPWNLPFMQKRTCGQPFMNHQCLWNPASPWLSESVLIMSSWGALTGLDATGWFAHAPAEFDPTLRRWGSGAPDVLGGFPAAALAFRMGYVKEGEPAVVDRRTYAQLRTRTKPLIAEGTGFDPTQDQFDISDESPSSALDPLVYLTGPVQVEFTEDDETPYVDPDLDGLIARGRSVVRSNTGELMLDMNRGYATVDTEKFKGVTGFLAEAGGEFSFERVRIEARDAYSTVMVVSLDDRPLHASRRILVQVTTTARPTGWKVESARFAYGKGDRKRDLDGYRITSTGRAPWQIARSDVSVTILNTRVSTAKALDSNGSAVGAVDLARADGGVSIRVPENTMYVVLRGKE